MKYVLTLKKGAVRTLSQVRTDQWLWLKIYQDKMFSVKRPKQLIITFLTNFLFSPKNNSYTQGNIWLTAKFASSIDVFQWAQFRNASVGKLRRKHVVKFLFSKVTNSTFLIYYALFIILQRMDEESFLLRLAIQ